jgi:cell wall-associated NlpC family hydrolase
MRSPARLLLLLVALVALSATLVSLGVVAWVGGTGGTGVSSGFGAVTPVVVPGGSANGESAAADRAVAWALDQLGTPYKWGGEGDGGFDCSGLVQAAFAAAGVALPRVAQDQYDAGPLLPPGTPLEPGDLVFFGTSPRGIVHVGIVVQVGEMVDAPHTGAVVRLEPIWSAGFVGATRPAP